MMMYAVERLDTTGGDWEVLDPGSARSTAKCVGNVFNLVRMLFARFEECESFSLRLCP